MHIGLVFPVLLAFYPISRPASEILAQYGHALQIPREANQCIRF